MIILRPREAMLSKCFLEEPVDKEVNGILNSENKKIILTGEKGSGRTTVLRKIEDNGLNTKEQSIYCWHNGVIMYKREPEGWYNEAAFDCYYELHLTNIILNYIQRNYPLIYDRYFQEYHEKTSKVGKEFDRIFNESEYNPPTAFKPILSTREISEEVVIKFRKLQDVEKVNLLIDAFDKINGSSKYVQELYQRYFGMFDKVVVIANDENIDAKRLKNDGYDIREIAYWKNKDTMREIIRRRLEQHIEEENKAIEKGQQTEEERRPIEIKMFLEDDFIERLIQELGSIGGLKASLNAVNRIVRCYSFETSFEAAANYAIKSIIKEDEQYKKVYREDPPKLYL